MPKQSIAWQQRWPLQIWSSWDPRIWLSVLSFSLWQMSTCIEDSRVRRSALFLYIHGAWDIGWHTGFSHLSCNAATTSATWNRRHRNVSVASIVYQLWPTVGCHKRSLLAASPGDAIIIWRGQISARRLRNCRAGQRQAKTVMSR
jgi:hypothetical protein